MSFDDETLLSAYLDGELDPARRRKVERALKSSPALAGRLRDLAGVRDALRGLSAPAVPEDLAPRIVSELRVRKRYVETVRAWKRAGLILGPFVGIAAGLLVAWSVWGYGADPKVPDPERLIVAERTTPEVVKPAPEEPEKPETVAEVELEVEEAPDVAEAVRGREVVAELEPSREREREEDQEALREILEHPKARRILIPVDVVDEESLKRVEDAIGLTARTHPRHARLRLYQGVVIDPENAGRAVVYAMALDSTEAANLKRNLGKSFGAVSKAEEVAPSVLAELSETVQLDVFETTPAGTILASGPGVEGRHQNARKSNEGKAEGVVEDVAPGMMGGGFERLQPPLRVRRGGGVSGPVVREGPKRRREDREHSVYLVWVVQKARREE